MKEFMKELREIKSISFATVSLDNKSKSRIFDIMDYNVDDLEFYFLTGKNKKVLKEIENNKYVSLNAMTPGYVSYRVEGKVEFKGDRDYLLKINPSVAQLYKGNETSLVPFVIKVTRAVKFDLSKEKPAVKNYRLS